MKVKDLIKKLKTVDGENEVFLCNGPMEENIWSFSGFSVDDNNDVQLYVVSEDKEA